VFGFGKRRTPTAIDRLRAGRWQCATCDVEHGWPFDLAARAPDPWPHQTVYEPNSALRLEGDFLSEDFCVLGGQYFFVRAVLEIPVRGLEQPFGFGCWSTLSRTNFERYVEGFDAGDYPADEQWTGWLCNQLLDYVGDAPVGVWVQLRTGRQRPLLWVAGDDEPLAVCQEEGMPPEEMVGLLNRYGHGPQG
jgi:hypothetical protein